MTCLQVLNEEDLPLYKKNKEFHQHLKDSWQAIVLVMKFLAKNQPGGVIYASGTPNEFRLILKNEEDDKVIVDIGKAPSKKFLPYLHIQIPLQDQKKWKGGTIGKNNFRKFHELVLKAGVAHLQSNEQTRLKVYQAIKALYPD